MTVRGRQRETGGFSSSAALISTISVLPLVQQSVIIADAGFGCIVFVIGFMLMQVSPEQGNLCKVPPHWGFLS
jgi:hypothetical protein